MLKNIIHGAIIVLLILVITGIVGSQTRLYQQHPVMPWNRAETPIAATGAATIPTYPAPASLNPADIARETAEHEKDRDILRAIERHADKLAASSLAQNYLLLFQAIIYFLTLIIIFSLLETVKKFADAASKSAEAARISAEAAGRAADAASGGHRPEKKREHNKFLVRRLRDLHRKL